MADKVEKVEKTVDIATQTEPKSVTVAYVGPNLIKYGLTTNQVYMQGVPERVKELPDDVKNVLVRLFVPTTQLGTALTDVKTKGKALNALFETAKGFRKENE